MPLGDAKRTRRESAAWSANAEDQHERGTMAAVVSVLRQDAPIDG